MTALLLSLSLQSVSNQWFMINQVNFLTCTYQVIEEKAGEGTNQLAYWENLKENYKDKKRSFTPLITNFWQFLFECLLRTNTNYASALLNINFSFLALWKIKVEIDVTDWILTDLEECNFYESGFRKFSARKSRFLEKHSVPSLIILRSQSNSIFKNW